MLSGNLPDDVMWDILSRLPAESLLRFKGVRKSWYALMKDPSFIVKHHQTRAAITNKGCVLIRRRRSYPTDYAFSLLHYNNNSEEINWVDLDLPCCFKKDLETMLSVQFVGACNGIFCVTHGFWRESPEVVLWNPAIRGEFKSLPPKSTIYLPPNSSFSACGCGFGIDPKTSDYKVVRIWTINHSNKSADDDGGYTNKVEVCTCTLPLPSDGGIGDTNHNNNSSSGSSWSWREIDAVPPALIVPIEPMYVKGKCYWRSASFRESLVSFDIGDEVFQEIQLPDARLNVRTAPASDFWGTIMVLNDSIALCSNPLEINENCIEVWLMINDGRGSGNGQEVSWTKYMSVKNPMDGITLGFWKNPGDCLFMDRHSNLHVPNRAATEGETKDVGIVVNVGQAVLIYNESLVSVKALNGI